MSEGCLACKHERNIAAQMGAPSETLKCPVCMNDELSAKNIALRAKLDEASEESTRLKAKLEKLTGALEYIELTGGNCGHDGMNKGVPCPCGACMAKEAARVLAEGGEMKGRNDGFYGR